MAASETSVRVTHGAAGTSYRFDQPDGGAHLVLIVGDIVGTLDLSADELRVMRDKRRRPRSARPTPTESEGR